MIDVVSLLLAKRRGELSREERVRRLREQYLADPTKAQKLIAAIMTQHVPPERKIRKRKYPTVLEAVEAAIPRSDPRRGMGRAIWETYNKMLINPEFRDYSPPELIAAAHEVELGKRREAVHEHTWRQRSGVFRHWPVIGAEPVAPLPDQEAWEQQQTKRPHTPAEVSAAIGGGFSLAGQLFRRWLAKRAVAAGAAAAVPGISVPAILTAAGMAIPEFYIYDKVDEAIRSTEWAKKHPWQATAVSLATAGGLIHYGTKLTRRFAAGLFGRLEKATRVADEAAEVATAAPTVENLLKHDAAKKKIFEEGELAARVLSPPQVRAPLLEMLAEAIEARRPKLPVPVEPPKGPGGPTLVSPYGVTREGRPFAKYLVAGPGEEPRRYTFKNITNVEEVFKKIAQGKSKEEALQEVGRAEDLLKKQVERPRISKEVRYELKRMGYTSQDIKQMTPEGVRVITRLVEAKKKGEDMNKVMKELARVVGVEKPKIEPPPGASTKELYEWAKGLSPQERYDLVEQGKLPRSVAKKIAAEEKAAKLPETEPSLEREPTPEELKESEEFLQSLGNIDGTVPGPDGKVKPAKAAEHARKLKGADKLLLGIVAASTLVPLAEVLGPTEAEAAGPEAVVTELAGAILKGARREGPKTLQKMLKALREAHIIPPPQTDPFVLPEPKRAIRIVPSLDLIQKKANMPFQGLATPHSYFWYYFGVKEGQELMANPAVQWADAQTTALYNATVGQKTLLRILNEIPGYRSSANELIEAMRPLMQKYYEPMQVRGYHAYMADKLKKAIDKEWARATKRKLVGEEKEKALSIIEALEEQYRAHTRELEKTAHIVDEYHEAWRRIVQPMSLQPRHIGLRVFLAAEDTADFIHYPWLKGRLSFDEQVAVARLKAMMEHYGARLLEAGEEIITHRPYMHHAPHPDANFERVEAAIKRFGRGVVPTPPLAKIFSRKAGFLPMVPDAEYCTTRYIQDINLRLEAMNFWRKGKPDGWWAFQQTIEANPGIAPEGLVRAFRAFARGFKPVENTPLNDLSNKLYAFEVARLLWMSPSVALKHLFKVLAGYRTFGLEAVKATPKALVSTVKLAIKRQRGGEAWLKKMGWSLDLMDQAVEAFTETGKLYRMIAEISPFMATESQAAKLLRRFNEMGSLPVSAVERFDRALSVVSALRMAAKKGMTPWQATYGVFDTILKANFLAGPLNPAWLRDPKIRLVMTFQGTPYKIMEQRAMLYSRAGGALLEVVKQLAKDIREGEMRFKWAMIKDALSRERDIFGTPVLKQALTEMLLVGTAIEVGKQAWDVELAHHFLHPPFVRVHRREVAIGASPLVGATVRALMAPEELKEEEFIVSRFFNEWFGRANRGLPLPATFVKLARLSKDDIPEIYRDRRLAYLFSIPTLD